MCQLTKFAVPPKQFLFKSDTCKQFAHRNQWGDEMLMELKIRFL